MKQMGKSRRLRAAAGLLVLLAAAPLVGNVDPKKGRVTANPTTGNSYSIEQEVQYGRKAIPEIEKELPLLPVDHPVSKYINALGQRLAAQAPGYKFPYTFRVVNQKEINAFALPGGPIYMNTGTIAAATRRNWPESWDTRFPMWSCGTQHDKRRARPRRRFRWQFSAGCSAPVSAARPDR